MSKLKSLDKMFDERHFDREIILLCVKYMGQARAFVDAVLDYKLSGEINHG